uniref:Uncharacterized protein n=1 Tax=Anguilla anguilla TaxID=7936 RepID=A0A0E9UJ73_ANGAN
MHYSSKLWIFKFQHLVEYKNKSIIALFFVE